VSKNHHTRGSHETVKLGLWSDFIKQILKIPKG